MSTQVRVRFAPSPTGGLHLGGIRTVLYNYLFAKKHNGKFILRIEDTDQTRFVAGAEDYIYDCLDWCGLAPDESPKQGGTFAPYRQSERKNAQVYQQYADKLVADGFAYLAFDTPEELEQMRNNLKTEQNPSPQYDAQVRMQMRNSLSLSKEAVATLLENKTPFVIRIKMPENETLIINDLIRGEVKFETKLIDDKVLLKRDGMPTYHLAVVVDDYLMQITHAFRGEEWLPSAPVHILLWQYLFGLDQMPKWAHLPLILGPNGKLSKRDGAKYGFPVFGMDWYDATKDELTKGFKEMGFLPEAFINLLAVLGWNNGSEQELFSISELIAAFDISRVHHAGAKFDWDKAKWFNAEWIKKMSNDVLVNRLIDYDKQQYEHLDKTTLAENIGLVKERCQLLSEFWQQLSFFYEAPSVWDNEAVLPKWNEQKQAFFNDWVAFLNDIEWKAEAIEASFKNAAAAEQLKVGELQMPLRIMLVGGKFGPNVFEIAYRIGKENTKSRIESFINQLG
jgi:glutamyl-tRNA synthetase